MTPQTEYDAAIATNQLAYAIAIAGKSDVWVPACGGNEPVFTSRSGKRMQYMFNPATGQHAYMDVDNDMIMTFEDANAALMM